MTKSLASLVGSDVMFDRASKAVAHSNYAVLQNRYFEEKFPIKITELAGRTFTPLAGFTVTISDVLPHSQIRKARVDDVMQFGSVEYATGYRLGVYLTVELDEDYLPLGVERKAFTDAVAVQVETILNTCGYTLNETPVMGLRSVYGVNYEQWDYFTRLFNVDEYAKSLLNTQLGPDVIPEFGETDTEFHFSAVLPAIPLNGGLLVHRNALGRMVELEDRKIYLNREAGQLLIEVDHMESWKYRLAFTSIEKMPHLLKGVRSPVRVEGQRVIVQQERDWKNPRLEDEIVLDHPQDWFYLQGNRKNTEAYGLSLSIYVTDSIDHIDRALLVAINAAVPRLLSTPQLKEKPASKPRRTFRRWVADGFRSFANWFDK